MPLPHNTPDKRDAILQATQSLLASLGFHGFSIRQVAERAGVAAGTVYLYFDDREDLIRQLRERIIREVARSVFANHDAEKDLSEQYRGICHNYWRFCVDFPEILSCKAQFDHLPVEVLRLQSEELKAGFRPLYQLFATGRMRGEIKDLCDEVLFSLTLEPLGSLARKQTLGMIEMNEQCLTSVIDACWDAITR